MKQSTSIRLNEGILKYAKSKGNASRYIEGLIKQDMAVENQKPIVQAVKLELLKDENFLFDLAVKLREPVKREKDDIEYDSDWGA